MASTDNPFDQIFDALWTLLESSSPLTSMLRERNKIKFNKQFDRDPIKQKVQVADLPELMLITDGSPESNIHFSSCGTMCRRAYGWVLSTGDTRVNLSLNEVEFAVYAAMVDAPQVLSSLTWRSENFVKQVDLDTLSEGLLEKDENRGVSGWSSIWACNTGIFISQQNLRDFHNGISET